MLSFDTASLWLERDELGRDELAVALRIGGVALGLGLVRDIEPFATRVVPEGVLADGVLVSFATAEAERATVPALDTLAGRLGGRVGGDVVVIL